MHINGVFKCFLNFSFPKISYHIVYLVSDVVMLVSSPDRSFHVRGLSF